MINFMGHNCKEKIALIEIITTATAQKSSNRNLNYIYYGSKTITFKLIDYSNCSARVF